MMRLRHMAAITLVTAAIAVPSALVRAAPAAGPVVSSATSFAAAPDTRQAPLPVFFGRSSHGGHGPRMLCGPRAQERVDAMVRKVEEKLTLSADQQTAWAAVVEAVRTGMRGMDAACQAGAASGSDMSAVDRLARVETLTAAAADAMRTIRPAFERFYGTLSEEQRGTIDAMMQRRHRR